MLIPVVLSGGAGTRLWPVSREGHPKPFIKLPDGQSLLKKTYLRACALDGVSDVLTITNRDYYFSCKDELAEAGELADRAIAGSFLLEPFGRNTAPAIAMGALWAAETHGGDAVLAVLPADHLIDDVASFRRVMAEAARLAAKGRIVTFGIRPRGPETGFGYIECGDNVPGGVACTVRRFTEKPSAETARGFLAAGNYLWNSGLFCFTAGTIIEQIERHAPEVHRAALACWAATKASGLGLNQAVEIERSSFGDVPDISIDYAVMEHSSEVVVLPAAFDWSDIGSWNALGEMLPPDDKGNSVTGENVLLDVSNSLVLSEDRLVAAIGVDNLVIVDTPDALLVAPRGRVQDVRQIVQQLKQMNHQSYRLHRTVSRPWGTFTVLEEGHHFKVKRLEVKPGASLSLQMHRHRSEHWVVVSGTARVVNGDSDRIVHTNESTYIPAGHKHRLENPGTEELVMIEVQSGSYVGEDDIIRLDDKYGRT